MATVKLLDTLQAMEVELTALNKAFTLMDITENLAINCQHILENTVFVQALFDIKIAVEEFKANCTNISNNSEENNVSNSTHERGNCGQSERIDVSITNPTKETDMLSNESEFRKPVQSNDALTCENCFESFKTRRLFKKHLSLYHFSDIAVSESNISGKY